MHDQALGRGVSGRWARRWWRVGWGLVCLSVCAARGADLGEARERHRRGDYRGSAALARAALAANDGTEQWWTLLVEDLRALGQLGEARAVLANALAQDSRGLRLRWAAHEVFRESGETNAAVRQLVEIIELAQARPWAYRGTPDRVAFGRAALALGAEPKRVLDRVFDAARRDDPDERDGHLACGELALDKHDYALAARSFQEGLKRLPEDPDLHFGLAQAYAPSDSALMLASLQAALKQNSNHVGALLRVADHLIDAEAYTEAERTLERVRSVNPRHPEAWAYHSVLAHLRGCSRDEQAALDAALKVWPTNPRVPHLIGLKLSQKYRFAEGAARQRQALAFDPRYLPAKAQLAQDLLRLGEETEGWQLAAEVEQADPFDVAAFNLSSLRNTMAKLEVVTNAHFILRMNPREAAVYGGRALVLLEEARQDLGGRYGVELDRPVLVEVFSDPKDFGVRTFGMPENHGFLGVCFGQVITANSPAARPGRPFNWEAMLWHELGHVITLQLTRNKMPRWLSEGISVYEERRANPAWGEQLVPRYREMLLGEDLTPISELSAAFLAPPTPLHLQFAYYQSSLVVEFLIEQYGFERLTAVLRDLGADVPLTEALEKHTAPLATLEPAYATFARQTAERLAPGLSWERPPFQAAVATRRPGAPLPRPAAGPGEAAWDDWARTRPTNYWVMIGEARRAMEAGRWPEARTTLERLVALFPEARGAENNPHRLLAETARELGDRSAERQALARLVELEGDAVDACRRLLELARGERDWTAVEQCARRHLAIDPLVPGPHRFLAEAAEARGQTAQAVESYRALLHLDPANPADLHFRLARQLHRAGDPAAKRHVLQALEDAPRHRAALELLLEIHRVETTAAPRTNPKPEPRSSNEARNPQREAVPEAARDDTPVRSLNGEVPSDVGPWISASPRGPDGEGQQR